MGSEFETVFSKPFFFLRQVAKSSIKNLDQLVAFRKTEVPFLPVDSFLKLAHDKTQKQFGIVSKKFKNDI